jgi:uncharacterized protein (TIGR02246 family)
MKLNRIAFFAVAIATACPSSVSASSGDEAQIRKLEDRYAAAVDAKDLDGIMKGYASDIFVFDVIPPRQYVGIPAFRKDWQGFLAVFKGPPHLAISDLVVSTDGQIAYSHSVQRFTGTDQKGVAFDMTFRFTDVYRKTNGKWLVVVEHASMPVDFDTLKPDVHSIP